ncbi:MAG: ribosome maturation factor RimM [Rhodospirillales bacterium]|nr:ribosome maturation factor RimM [Rhodospirillales bacterium]MCW8953273.1 ribosome maturation factor RimM [Rhodospirillales bacterium]
MTAERVCVGVVSGPHGVRGLVKVRSFTEVPEDMTAYGPLTDEDGSETYRIAVTGRGPKGLLLARVEGIADRDAAEALKGTRFYVEKAALPPPDEDEFYYSDLIGLVARTVDGDALGTVRAVGDFGAGDVVEVAGGSHGVVMVPFTRAAVPVVDLESGVLTIDPPPGLLEPAEPEPKEGNEG